MSAGGLGCDAAGRLVYGRPLCVFEAVTTLHGHFNAMSDFNQREGASTCRASRWDGKGLQGWYEWGSECRGHWLRVRLFPPQLQTLDRLCKLRGGKLRGEAATLACIVEDENEVPLPGWKAYALTTGWKLYTSFLGIHAHQCPPDALRPAVACLLSRDRIKVRFVRCALHLIGRAGCLALRISVLVPD